MGDELLCLVGEALRIAEVADVVAGREHRPLTGEQEAAGLEPAGGRGERVEQLVVERAALLGVVDREASHLGGGLVEQELARGEALAAASRAAGPRASA